MNKLTSWVFLMAAMLAMVCAGWLVLFSDIKLYGDSDKDYELVLEEAEKDFLYEIVKIERQEKIKFLRIMHGEEIAGDFENVVMTNDGGDSFTFRWVEGGAIHIHTIKTNPNRSRTVKSSFEKFE